MTDTPEVKICKLFGISEKRESQLRNFFAKENLRANTITELSENIELLKGEETYIAYLFGRHIQSNEQIKMIGKMIGSYLAPSIVKPKLK